MQSRHMATHLHESSDRQAGIGTAAEENICSRMKRIQGFQDQPEIVKIMAGLERREKVVGPDPTDRLMKQIPFPKRAVDIYSNDQSHGSRENRRLKRRLILSGLQAIGQKEFLIPYFECIEREDLSLQLR